MKCFLKKKKGLSGNKKNILSNQKLWCIFFLFLFLRTKINVF